MDMTYRPLGRSGLMVSAVGIGTNAFSRRVDQDGVSEILDTAQEVGVTLLDTADIYGVHPGASEELLGHALKGRRDEFVVATNFDGWQVADAAWTSATKDLEPFVSAQNRYSLLDRDVESELVPACGRFGLGMLPFFPL